MEFNESYKPEVGDVCKVYLWDLRKYGVCRISKKYTDKRQWKSTMYDVEKIDWLSSEVTERGFIDGAFDIYNAEATNESKP